MRVLAAPGAFGHQLTAAEAAEAIALGWRRRAAADEVVLAPVSDGGGGYVDVLHANLGGELRLVSVAERGGSVSPATIVVTGETAYVEAAQLDPPASDGGGREPEHASSFAVGRLVAEVAKAGGVRRIVVGVGPAGTPGQSNDGAAGFLAGVGAVGRPVAALLRGSTGLAALEAVDLGPARKLLCGVDLVVVTDCEAALLGLRGTTRLDGVRRGLAEERIPAVDLLLERFADLAGRRPALAQGAGAGGGLGYGVLLLGGTRAAGLSSVLTDIGLADRCREVDLVVTGESVLDAAPGSGRVSAAVAATASAAVRPCIALADEVKMGSRELRASGIESAYAVPGHPSASEATAADRLAALAERVARTWSWSR